MAYWLVKTDPETYSWHDLVKDKKTIWDGVRNYQARNNLANMKKGDTILFYHSQDNGKEIVGIAEISKESFHDETSDDPRWLAVEIKPIKPLKSPVPLSKIKELPALSNISLVKQGRLSVMSLTEDEYKIIIEMGT